MKQSREDDVLLEKYFHIHTPSSDARKLFLYPQLSAFAVCDRSYYRSRFSYDYFVLLLLKKGAMFVDIPNHSYVLSSGDVLLIDMQHPHIYGTLGDTQPELYWMHFNGKQMLSLYNYIVSSVNSHVFSVDSLFSLQFESLIKNLASKDVMPEMEISAELHSLLSKLIIKTKQKQAVLDPAIYYIHKHYSAPISLEYLSSLVHMSIPHFCARFRKQFGDSPYSYVINTRMTAACHTLLSSRHSIEEIAASVGFKSTSSFIKAFTKKYKKTPGQMRRENIISTSDTYLD